MRAEGPIHCEGLWTGLSPLNRNGGFLPLVRFIRGPMAIAGMAMRRWRVQSQPDPRDFPSISRLIPGRNITIELGSWIVACVLSHGSEGQRPDIIPALGNAQGIEGMGSNLPYFPEGQRPEIISALGIAQGIEGLGITFPFFS